MAFICRDLAAKQWANLHIVGLFDWFNYWWSYFWFKLVSISASMLLGLGSSLACSFSRSLGSHRRPGSCSVRSIVGSNIVLGRDHFVGFAGGIKLTDFRGLFDYILCSWE
jgi:hypothetical protein